MQLCGRCDLGSGLLAGALPNTTMSSMTDAEIMQLPKGDPRWTIWIYGYKGEEADDILDAAWKMYRESTLTLDDAVALVLRLALPPESADVGRLIQGDAIGSVLGDLVGTVFGVVLVVATAALVLFIMSAVTL